MSESSKEPCSNEDCDRCDPRPRWNIDEHRVEHVTYHREIKAATPEEALAIFEAGTAWPSSYDDRSGEVIQQDAPVIERVTDDFKLKFYREECCYHDLPMTSGSEPFPGHEEADPFATGPIEPPSVASITRDERQQRVTVWARAAFGEVEATSLPQRGIRLLEEAIEAFQACGGHEDKAHQLVAYVFARPSGEVGQELGGVAVTMLALAAAAGLSADEEECREIDRVLVKPIAHFTERNANKNAAGFRVATTAPDLTGVPTVVARPK